jgi:DNA-binding transcriptional ArsR family regulator
MNTAKVLRRIARMGATPEVAEQIARDLGFALARDEREALAAAAREMAARAPGREDGDRGDEYWAGFVDGLGTLIASWQAAQERADARRAALEAVSSETARGAVRALTAGPATGAELATALGVTPGAASKALATLRGAGLVRVLGGQPYPKRGARKPHGLTPLGTWLVEELERRAETEHEIGDVELADVG